MFEVVKIPRVLFESFEQYNRFKWFEDPEYRSPNFSEVNDGLETGWPKYEQPEGNVEKLNKPKKQEKPEKSPSETRQASWVENSSRSQEQIAILAVINNITWENSEWPPVVDLIKPKAWASRSEVKATWAVEKNERGLV